ncbi:MAG TPA: TlyA family RNA methyltransferase [Caulobacteraceae bacterium]|nr:TlyA family RNA methyltransferase [Caulobacteraceae bacterium]
MARKRIDVLLVERGLFDSRAKAQAAIADGRVAVGGRVMQKASDSVEELADVIVQAAEDWVGRGAFKLAAALARWPLAVRGRTVLDIGASTGGFTEVCLRAGAAKVFAVDVGRDQLHPRVAADARVQRLEGVDARSLSPKQIDIPPDLIVCDASFIGLAKVLPAALVLAAPGADLIALVKPQFEVGQALVGKGGLVKDEGARLKAVADVAAFLEGAGWTVRETAPSPITGGDGNVEYLLWACRA